MKVMLRMRLGVERWDDYCEDTGMRYVCGCTESDLWEAMYLAEEMGGSWEDPEREDGLESGTYRAHAWVQVPRHRAEDYAAQASSMVDSVEEDEEVRVSA